MAGPALALAAALAAAGCAAATAGTGSTSANAPARAAAPVTAAQAARAFNAYVATTAQALAANDGTLALSVVTGAQRAIVSAGLTMDGAHLAPGGSGAYSGVLTLESAAYTYGTPAFYLPEPAGYPRFFVAGVTRAVNGINPAKGATASIGGAEVPIDGRVLMLFEQSTAAGPWLLASTSQLPPGMTLPPLAAGKHGYIPQVPLTSTGLLAQPYAVGPLQATVVDDGPASAAAKAVDDGPLTTALYQAARDRSGTGLQAPRGDSYQWDMEGTSYPAFALRTANGGALVLYAMYLNAAVAVPSYIDKADPIDPGPPIQVPLGLSLLLPSGHATPRVELEAQDLLSFAAVDPPAGAAKIQVIAIGGGLNYAAAS